VGKQEGKVSDEAKTESAREWLALQGIHALIDIIDPESDREGVAATPARVLKAYREMTEGYGADIGKILGTTFDAGDSNEMIVVKHIEFVSLCEHHLLPFTGTATVAYLPRARVVGLSKIARLIDAYARRLQIQERLTTQITTALDQHLETFGSASLIRATHACMGCRGVRKPSAEMITSSLTGKFRTATARAEFLALAAL
jgi:GTP cyclohydrolase IA